MEVELDPQVSLEEIMSPEVELDPQVSLEEIMSREVELGCESWTSVASGCSSTAVHFHRSGGGPRSLRSFSGGIHGRAFTLSSLSHSVPVANKLSRFCGRKATLT